MPHRPCIATTVAASLFSLAAQAAPVELITNGGAEAGDLSGWTLDASAIPAGERIFASVTSQAATGFSPRSGDRFFTLANASTGAASASGVIASITQAVDVEPNEFYLVRISMASAGPPSCDPGRIQIDYVDDGGETLGFALDTGWRLDLTWTDFEPVVLPPDGATTLRITLSGRLDCGTFIDTYFDAVSVTRGVVGCNTADVAAPFGCLDIADVVAFLQRFGARDPAADLAAPFGAFDIADVVAFLQVFGAGCP